MQDKNANDCTLSQIEDLLNEKHDSVLYLLKPTEREIISYLVRGLTNKQISRNIHTSEANVKHYFSDMLERFQLNDRVHLAVWAIAYNVVPIQTLFDENI